MHLAQTKKESRKTGGPQYWFQGEPAHVTGFLEQKKTCAVILMTPYGPVETSFVLVHQERKITRSGQVVRANAQHHRVQKGQSKESIGEAIRRWFGLRKVPGRKLRPASPRSYSLRGAQHGSSSRAY